MATENARVNLYINSEKAQASLDQLNNKKIPELKKKLKSVNEGTKEWKTLNAELQKSQKQAGYLEGQLSGKLGPSMKDLSSRVFKLKKELREMPQNAVGRSIKIKELRKAEKELAKVRMEVNGVSKAFGTWKNKMGSILKLGGVASIGLAIAAGFKRAFNTINEFDVAIDNLASITGVRGKELDFFRKEARNVAIEVKRSATEVVKAYEIVGSAQPELLKNKEALAAVTREALILANASGMELPESAKALTSAMNQFNAPADQAAKYINALAAGSLAGASGIPKTTQALEKFGAVADGANLSVEESVALIETLAEKGIEGAEAGTNLRNFLLKLQDGADETNPAIVGLDTALSNLEKQGLSASQMTEKFGLENTLAATILVRNTETIQEYTKAVTDTNTAYEQAGVRMDNFKGDLNEMGSLWDSLILSVESGDGAISNAFRGAAQWVNGLLKDLKDTNEVTSEIEEVTGRSYWGGLFDLNYTEIGDFAIELKNVREEMVKNKSTMEDWNNRAIEILDQANELSKSQRSADKDKAKLLMHEYEKVQQQITSIQEAETSAIKQQLEERNKIEEEAAIYRVKFTKETSNTELKQLIEGAKSKIAKEEALELDARVKRDALRKREQERIKDDRKRLWEELEEIEATGLNRQIELDKTNQLLSIESKYLRLEKELEMNDQFQENLKALKERKAQEILELENQIALEKDQRELEELEKEYEKKIERAASDTELTLALEAQKDAELKQLKEEQRLEAEQRKQRADESEIKSEQEKAKRLLDVQNELAEATQELEEVKRSARGEGLAALGEMFRQNEDLYKAFFIAEKTNAIFEIFSQLEKEKAAIRAGAYLLSGGNSLIAEPIIQAKSSIANIRAGISAAKVGAQVIGSFVTGGFTGRGHYRDETGRMVAGVVHDNEYVVATEELQVPAISKMVDVIESVRLNRRRGFNDGGYSNPSAPVTNQSATNTLPSGLDYTPILNDIFKLLALNLDKPSIAFFGSKQVREIRKQLKELDQIEKQSKLS